MNFGDSFLAERQREQREAARARLGRLRQTSLEAQLSFENELRQAAAATPRSASGEALYTETGLRSHREQLAGKVRQNARPVLEDLRDSVERDARLLREHAEKIRPRIGDDAGTRMRVQQRWDQVRMKLTAGMSLRTIIDHTDDAETLLAIAEWAPSHLEAANYRQPGLGETYAPPDHTQLLRTIDGRLAEVIGGEVGDALSAAQEVDVAVAGYEKRAAYLDALASDEGVPAGRSAFETAVAANVAEQMSRSTLTVEPEPEAALAEGA